MPPSLCFICPTKPPSSTARLQIVKSGRLVCLYSRNGTSGPSALRPWRRRWQLCLHSDGIDAEL